MLSLEPGATPSCPEQADWCSEEPVCVSGALGWGGGTSLLRAALLPQGEHSESRSVLSDPLRPHGLYGLWNSPGQNTGVGCLSLLQGIFPTQRLSPGLLHCRRILYQLSYQGSPRILEWVVYPFSRGSSRPRNRTRTSCIAGGFFTSCAMREAPRGRQCLNTEHG